ncbi:MAG: glycine betaine/L-proline ABC transporter substrate-binding protein ProX [Desulfofustis sp.]|nr:glycine betaine/L-proline ABC transporter substrate-binding protein ProX [Desulfofustis sp.]
MMMKQLVFAAAIALLTVGGTVPAASAAESPGQGVTLNPARATWNTGFFQEALIRRAMETLGYAANKPKDLANPIFYKSVTLGDVDYWANGWFPMHDAQLPKDFDEKAEKIGFVAKAGGMGGYLVSKRDVDKFGITSLEDFKRDDVKKAFDSNGDGKADLTACPPGWGCEKVIDHHLSAYGLNDHINASKASYEAGMASALGNYKDGKPVFFYTWTPNWTVYKFKPGEDVMWINVPEIKPSDAQKGFEERMTVSGVVGAVSDPVNLGFVASDIRVVANKEFLAANPAAKRFFEVFTLPLEDINAQNTRMNEGEKSDKDIERHVDEWIANNQKTWDSWLEEARKATK